MVGKELEAVCQGERHWLDNIQCSTQARTLEQSLEQELRSSLELHSLKGNRQRWVPRLTACVLGFFPQLTTGLHRCSSSQVYVLTGTCASVLNDNSHYPPFLQVLGAVLEVSPPKCLTKTLQLSQ